MIATRSALLACLALSVATAGPARAGGAVPVGELLGGRTAHVRVAERVMVVFHGADGAMAIESANGAPAAVGRWWIDDAGRYCREVAEPGAPRCFDASMKASQLELRDREHGAVLLVEKLLPGDVNDLTAAGGASDGPCNCRLTSRRRGDERVR